MKDHENLCLNMMSEFVCIFVSGHLCLWKDVHYAQNKVKKGYHLFLNHICFGRLNGIAERNALGNFLILSSILVGKTCSGTHTLLKYNGPHALLEILVVAPCLLS